MMRKKSEEKSKVQSTRQKNKSVTIFPSGKQIHGTIQFVRNSITLINLTKRGNKEPGKKTF